MLVDDSDGKLRTAVHSHGDFGAGLKLPYILFGSVALMRTAVLSVFKLFFSTSLFRFYIFQFPT